MVEFKSFTSGKLYEPLVIGLFLYDADANKKITETFYFDCKKMDVNQLGFNVNIFNNNNNNFDLNSYLNSSGKIHQRQLFSAHNRHIRTFTSRLFSTTPSVEITMKHLMFTRRQRYFKIHNFQNHSHNIHF